MQDFMRYKDYYGSVNFDSEDLIIYGKLEFIQALVTYEATDIEELKKAFEDAVENYLKTCTEKPFPAT